MIFRRDKKKPSNPTLTPTPAPSSTISSSIPSSSANSQANLNSPPPVQRVPSKEFVYDPILNEALNKDNLIQKQPNQWTQTEVGQWLTMLNMDEFRISFLENGISGEELLELTEKDLVSLGVKKLGDRKSLLKSIANLKTRKPFEEDSASLTSEDSGENASFSSEPSAPIYYTDVVVKCYLPSGEIRIIDVPLIQSIDDLKQKLLSEFSIEYVMRYKDEDGDMVLFHSDNDLRRAVINGNLKVHLIPLNDLTPQECESLEQIVNAVTVIDKKGNILFMNNRGLTLFGYSKDEVLGKNVRILMTKQDARHHQTYIKNYLETGFARIIGKDRVVQCLKADGNTFGARLVVTEKKDTSGRHIFTGTLTEIEDQESLSLNSMVSSWAVFDASLDATIVINDQGSIVFFNKAAERLFGYARNEVQNTNVKLLMPQPFRDQHDKFIANYNRSGVSKIIGIGREVPIQIKGGTIKRALLKLSKQEISRMTFFVGVLLEKETSSFNKTLLEQEREIINSLLLPAVIIDISGTIQAWNSAAEQLLGYEMIDVIGKNITLIMIGEDREKHDSYLKHYASTGKSKILGRGRKVIALSKKGEAIALNMFTSEKSEMGKKFFTGIFQPVN